MDIPKTTDPLPIKEPRYDAELNLETGIVRVWRSENGKLSLDDIKRMGFDGKA